MARTLSYSIAIGSVLGLLAGAVVLGAWMGIYLVGGIAQALRSADTWGLIPNAVATPAFYYLMFLVPALLVGLVLGAMAGLAVGVLRDREHWRPRTGR
jgi:hypothetical protein